MSAHKKNNPSSLLHEATTSDFRARNYSARHAVSRGTGRGWRKPPRWTAAVAAVAAVGAIAAVGVTGRWGGANPGLAADARSGQASTLTATSAQQVGQPTTAKAVPHRPPTPSAGGQPTARPTPKHTPSSSSSPAGHATGGSTATGGHGTSGSSAGAAKPSAKPTQSPQSSQPVMFYDSVEPTFLPAGEAAAVYADGPFATSAAALAGHGNVVWIDVNGGDPDADALDVEPGDATATEAAAWASAKLTANPDSYAIIYTFRAAWPSVISAIGTLPSSMQSHVKYWIADPTGVPHILPGAAATQWAWGSRYDSDMAEPDFFA